MKLIQPRGKFKNLKIIVDDEDYKVVSNISWYIYYNKSGSPYVVSSFGKGRIHRLIMKPPKGSVVDHINGNPLDNRRKNLRVCSQSENLMNRKRYKNSSREYKGVYKHGQRWQAHISVGGKNTFIGSYQDQIEAAKAYDKQAKEIYGQYANPNFAT